MIHALDELRTYRQWVVWRLEEPRGKPTKVPYCALTGEKAAVNDPMTWCDYVTAIEAADRYQGVGFVVTADDPFVGIDMDGCVHETGEIAAWALDVLEAIDSYGEWTPSGRGIRLWLKGVLPPDGRVKRWNDPTTGHKYAIEFYDCGRFFTVTEKALPDPERSIQIEERSAALVALHSRIFAARPEPVTPRQVPAAILADEAILETAARARNGAAIVRLYGGDWSGYPSQSEADQALLYHFAFYTKDAAQLDRLFRRSRLYREKWDERHYADRRTYGEVTIANAIRGVFEQYHAPIPQPPHPADDPEVRAQTPPPDLAQEFQEEERTTGTRAAAGGAVQNGEQPERTWRTFTFDTMAAQGLEEPEFPVAGLLREGVNLFMGKTGDGKTFWSVDAAIAVSTGGKALGHRDVIQGDVLYLALEESRAEMFQRLLQLRDETTHRDLSRLEVASAADEDWPVTSMSAMLDAIEEWLVLHPKARLVILDPLLGYLALAAPQQQQFLQAEYNIIRNLRMLARRHPGVAILVHDHRSKAQIGNGREPMDTGVHSTGLIASVDNRMVLVKEEGLRFKLTVKGRMVPMAELVHIFDPSTGGWEIKEDERVVRQSDVALMLLRALEEVYPEPQHTTALANSLSLPHGTVKGRLFRMERAGSVVHAGPGLYRATNPGGLWSAADARE